MAVCRAAATLQWGDVAAAQVAAQQRVQALRQHAYRLLARRDYSAWELGRKLALAECRRVALNQSGDESSDSGKTGDEIGESGESCASRDKVNAEIDADSADSAESADAVESSDSTDSTQAAIDRLLAELAAQGAQSDARFAEARCRWLIQSGKGSLKLRYELTAHQLPAALIAQVMAVYIEQWPALAAQARRKKFGDTPPATYAEWAKQAKFLQQRGFSTDHIAPYVE